MMIATAIIIKTDTGNQIKQSSNCSMNPDSQKAKQLSNSAINSATSQTKTRKIVIVINRTEMNSMMEPSLFSSRVFITIKGSIIPYNFGIKQSAGINPKSTPEITILLTKANAS